MRLLMRGYYLVFFCMMVSLTNSALAMHWQQVKNSIQNSKKTMSYEQTVRFIDLLIDKKAIQKMGVDEYKIADGFIQLSRHSIKSFKNKNGTELEFEYIFSDSADEHVNCLRSDLVGISIALDVVTDSSYFNADHIGTMIYKDFVVGIQEKLASNLREAGAEISYLRPQKPFVSASLDSLNENPPHIVISPQFNNDRQDCMVTFAGGNILPKEFAQERNRARFIQALITGKHYNSSCLAACITKRCQAELMVEPLSWKKASFEGNARPVSVGQIECALSSEEGYLNGVMTRNLLHNGLFARAVVNPFPDMQWAKNQVVAGRENEWIEKYAITLTKAIIDYVTNNPEVF